ncbi:MAG: type 1 glutamine amidotransferase [Pseudomonadota bacterium]
MTRVLIVESETPDVSARFGRRLAVEYGRALRQIDPAIEFEVENPYVDPLDAARLARYHAVAFPGSTMDWSTDAPEARPLRAAMEAVFTRGLPCFGSCNGMQLAAVVLGGSVGSAAELEVGLARNIKLTAAGRNHPMLAGRPATYAVPAIHRDQVTELPSGAVCLAGNTHTANQAFTYEQSGVDFWGVQYHPEYSPADVARSLASRPMMFAQHMPLLQDLKRADHSSTHAAQLGSTPEELLPPQRDTELRQWVARIKSAS